MNNILDEIIKKILVIDGAMGTFLQQSGMPIGVSPELWAVSHPQILKSLHRQYIDAGADIIITCTFGANRLKLKEFNLENKVDEINNKAVEIAKSASEHTKTFIAGGLGPIGKFIEPFGELKVSEAIKIFKEQIKIFVDNKVDLILIETLSDIQEARCSLIAAKEITEKIPVAVSLTFDENQRTLNGTDPLTALFTLQELGADIISTNCSVGPKEMVEIIKIQKDFSNKFLMAEPNAGLPVIKDGKTVFNLTAEEFARWIPEFVNYGINIIGGCCGTTPEFIMKIKECIKDKKPFIPKHEKYTALTSITKTVFISSKDKIKFIGEKINPTGKKQLSEELKNNNFNEVRRFAIEQSGAGADILDVNVGVPGIDEKEIMKKVIETIFSVTQLPLCIDSANIDVIEEALKFYPGIVLINSISFEDEKCDRLLKLSKKYGSNFIFLPLSGKKLTKTAEERISLIEKMMDKLNEYNISRNKIIVDGLVLTASSNTGTPLETLKTIKYANDKGLNTIIGLSNVSFGLPEREILNATFLTLAAALGLTSVIINPCAELNRKAIKAINVLMNKDKDCKEFINYFTAQSAEPKITESGESKSLKNLETRIREAVLNGEKENITALIIEAKINEWKPFDIVDKLLIPAINEVGMLYEKRIYFLPQLIRSAETTEIGFNFLKKDLERDAVKKIGKIIIATVKGDIHDIGKNIVSLMFRNFGFDVIDLGKDVDKEKIIEAALKHNADIIGLSALMTTTMIEMKSIIEYKNRMNCKSKILIGGAVTTKKYADEIGADSWAKDSIEAIKSAKELLEIK